MVRLRPQYEDLNQPEAPPEAYVIEACFPVALLFGTSLPTHRSELMNVRAIPTPRRDNSPSCKIVNKRVKRKENDGRTSINQRREVLPVESEVRIIRDIISVVQIVRSVGRLPLQRTPFYFRRVPPFRVSTNTESNRGYQIET